MKRILILKRTSFGDIIHALPVIPAIRNSHPDSEITWLTELGYGPFLRAVEGIDTVVEIGLRSMLRRGRIGDYFRRLRSLRKGGEFDVLIDLQGTLKSWLLIMRARARRKIGFNRADAREPLVTRLYSDQAPPMPDDFHIIQQNLKLLESVGIEAEETKFPRIKNAPEQTAYIDKWLARHGLNADPGFVVINPFTAWRTKSWPLEHAAALCRMVRRELGSKSLLLFGPKEKEEVGEAVKLSEGAAMPAPPTDILQLLALLRRTRAYVGGDTGPTHLAAALRVPLVAMFGPTDPQRNGPIDPADPVIRADLGCDRCSRNTCPESDNRWAECMRRISPDTVLQSLRVRLETAATATLINSGKPF
ncbi:MAG TPA: glycosyltransferase family 9 protein [Acidobacteriota bacterium]|nr:glycosyltransferase family 9 protein [Acidobacteriota bacterium]